MAKKTGKPKKTKLTIYLLKDGINPEKALGDEPKNYKSIDLDNGIFYYGESTPKTPDWVNSFFKNKLDEDLFKNQSSKGVYSVKVDVNSERKTFALSFSHGHSMLNDTYCVGDFGLKLALNIIINLRKIKQRTLTSVPKNVEEQLSKAGDMSDFGFDVEQDLLEGVTGIPKECYQEIFGSSAVTGKTSFSVSASFTIDNIKDFLKECYEHYQKEDYKEDFSFIDSMREIHDTEKFEKKLIDEINNGMPGENTKLCMAIPEMIEWEEIEGFSFGSSAKNLMEDISLVAFKEFLIDKTPVLNIESLEKRRVSAFSNVTGSRYKSWSVFKCLCWEFEDGNDLVILVNGKWHKIAKDFVDQIESAYKSILLESQSCSTDFISHKSGEHEKCYNQRLTDSISNALLMDRKNIKYGGGGSSVEFCDVYDVENKSFIHVKKYYGSSALSHLFAQGRVSGELFIADSSFREAAKKKEPRLPFDSNQPSREYKVVFGIIMDKPEKQDIPFFSKVNLKNTVRFLKALGFTVYLVNIGLSVTMTKAEEQGDLSDIVDPEDPDPLLKADAGT